MKCILKLNQRIYLLVSAIRFSTLTSFFKIDGTNRKYPKVIQLPLTYKCNSRCVMCGISNMDSSNEATIEEFAKFMQDPIFKEVESVGINGGEPSLVKNLPQYAREILKLPKIRNLNIISNGLNKRLLLSSIEEIFKDCHKIKVNFHVSISLDGYGNVHDAVRCVPGAFCKAVSTIDEIINNKSKYCDSIDVGCTIVNQNINNLIELDVFANRNNYDIKYRLGINNKRIGSDQFVDKFSVVFNQNRQTAKEFFHYQMSCAKSFHDKYKYYSIFSWLDSKKPKRMLGCQWKDQGVTIDSRGEMFYCAVASDSIGSLRKQKGENIFFEYANIDYRKNLIRDHCDSCIHDYVGKPLISDVFIFFKRRFFERISMKLFRIKAKFL